MPREESDILIIDDKGVDDMFAEAENVNWGSVSYVDQAMEFLNKICEEFKNMKATTNENK